MFLLLHTATTLPRAFSHHLSAAGKTLSLVLGWYFLFWVKPSGSGSG